LDSIQVKRLKHNRPFDWINRILGKECAPVKSNLALVAIFVFAIFSACNNLIAEDITFARPDIDSSIAVSADTVTRWQVGHYEVLHLKGSVQIQQQQMLVESGEAILWVEIGNFSDEAKVYKTIAYLENQVVIELPRNGDPHQVIGTASDRIVDDQWLGRFFTRQTVDLNRKAESLGARPEPAIFARAQTALENGNSSSVQAASFAAPAAQLVVSPQTGQVQQVQPAISSTQTGQGQYPLTDGLGTSNSVWPTENLPQNLPNNVGSFGTPGAAISQSTNNSPFNVEVLPRDSSGINFKDFPNPLNANERVTIGVGGFRISATSPAIDAMDQFRSDQDRQVNILADNMVRWLRTNPDGTETNQFYLEGNVVFSKDKRVIYAKRMFYDVTAQKGTILDAEVLTPVQDFRGVVRLKADVVQQVNGNNMQAYGTAVTSSRLGVPSYWLQSESVDLTRQPMQAIDPQTGFAKFDPVTGQPVLEDEYFVESKANRVYLGGVPVFAWPSFKTSLNDPSLYLERFGINNDGIFGTQITTGWDMYQLLTWKDPPRGTKWIGILDYLSERGLGYGSEFSYRRNELFGYGGQVEGDYRSWFIKDNGLDFLGQDRLGLAPEEERRGRLYGRHRHEFAPGFTLRGEIGYISDRNFLEQYYEREWDTEKDQTTGFWLERNIGTRSYNLTTDIQVNDFFAQTTWLPRYDQFTLGQPIFNDRGVWFGHTHAGYAKLRPANAPTSATELAKFDPLAWEAKVDGVRVGTRQELDFPTQIGPWKVIPYVLADITYWQEDLTGNDLVCGYGQTGLRASLPMWKSDPSIQSTLWNVNGLTHKVNFDFDASYADASQDLNELPLYDQLDDDSQEHFRRRFAFDTFGILPGGDVPLPYDERYFALRSGMQGNVTAPSMEIADDLTVIKMGARQRWQTKRGLPGQERIIDWITFDSQVSLFPDAEEQNFGADFGLFDYDFQWHVGDRFSLVSDGYFDFFSQGLRTASFGANIGRPEVGNAYVGYRMIEGPISSNILSANLVYRMSQKWGVKAGGQVDFGETGSIGQTLSFVYIGESFLWQFGINHDVSRDNVGFRFGFEPRFLTQSRLFRPGGTSIPPAGSRYLE
jgi:lipopolysaccharide export system protein LptA